MIKAAKVFSAFFLIAGLLALFPATRAEDELPDPGARGPWAVTREEYDFGDTALALEGIPGRVEMRASVHYPADLSAEPDAKFPLILFLHGRHAPCQGSLMWPCPSQSAIVPNHRGYDYLADILASHGYIVASISANGLVPADALSSDLGTLGRARLIQAHLDQWKTFNTTGGTPFGAKFIGKVDMSRVGTMGHSAGGEGAARQFLLNQQLGSPHDIKAVFGLAPTDFTRLIINNVPLAVLLPYCDGDVRDLQGVHYFDDSRYNLPGDRGPKHSILVLGANHNFYNTVWTGDDSVTAGDSHCSPGSAGRLTDIEQRNTGIAYICAFFRMYVGGETVFSPYLTGEAEPPPSATTQNIFVSYHPPDAPALRRDVNRFLDSSSLSANALGGEVSQTGLAPYGLCGGASHCLLTEIDARQPHTAPSISVSRAGLIQLLLGWDTATAIYSEQLPEGKRDVSSFEAFQFRAAVNYGDSRNPAGLPQDLTVTLTDGAGQTASVRVSQFSRALFYPPGQTRWVPKILLNMVRLPLSAFVGVTLSDIRVIRFIYDQRATGSLMIADLAFTSPAMDSGPPDPGGESDEGDPDGPEIKRVTISSSGRQLVIKGKRMTGQLTMEINGVVIAPPLVVKPNSSGKKSKVKGSLEEFNLRPGANRIRLRGSTFLRSNVFTLNL